MSLKSTKLYYYTLDYKQKAAHPTTNILFATFTHQRSWAKHHCSTGCVKKQVILQSYCLHKVHTCSKLWQTKITKSNLSVNFQFSVITTDT